MKKNENAKKNSAQRIVERENSKTAKLFKSETEKKTVVKSFLTDQSNTQPITLYAYSASQTLFSQVNTASPEYRKKITEIMSNAFTNIQLWIGKQCQLEEIKNFALSHIATIQTATQESLAQATTSMKVSDINSNMHVTLLSVKLDIFALTEEFDLEDSTDLALWNKAQSLSRSSEFYQRIDEVSRLMSTTWRVSPDTTDDEGYSRTSSKSIS